MLKEKKGKERSYTQFSPQWHSFKNVKYIELVVRIEYHYSKATGYVHMYACLSIQLTKAFTKKM